MRKRTRRPKAKPSEWQASRAFRSIASAAITEWNKKRRTMPKCSARRKHDGEPCQQLAMTNGKCAWHGGKTPKGDQWHRHQWPDRDGPAAMEKLYRKQAQIDRQAIARKARLAAMSADERAAHDEWTKARQPGSAAARMIKRRDRQTAAEIRALVSRPDPAPTEEEAQIAAKIEELRKRRAALEGDRNVEKSEG